MKRLYIFLGVGPLIFFVWLFAAGAGQYMTPLSFLLFLVVTYAAGVIPASLACFVDHLLSDRAGDFKRAGITALAGCIIVAATAAIIFQRVDLGLVPVGLVGGVAGLVCSLLSMKAA